MASKPLYKTEGTSQHTNAPTDTPSPVPKGDTPRKENFENLGKKKQEPQTVAVESSVGKSSLEQQSVSQQPQPP
jgi:hypothetical protein